MSPLTICNAFLTDVITEHAQFFPCAQSEASCNGLPQCGDILFEGVKFNLNYHEFDFHTKISAYIIKVKKASYLALISSTKRTKSFLNSALVVNLLL